MDREQRDTTPASWSAWMIAAALACAAPCAAQTQSQALLIPATPPDYPRGRISGYIFGDYYDNLAGNPDHGYSSSGADSLTPNIDGSKVIGRDLNGLQVRRVYFQLDNDLSFRFSTRFRLEMDGKSLTSDGKLGVNVKAAYAQARSVYPRADVLVGVLSTPIWEGSEEFWQYRSIEKTIGDFRGIGSSADVGIELKGFADSDHHVGYVAMIGDGPGQKAEDNRYKKFYLSLPLRAGDLRLEPYADYENAFGAKDRATYKLFVGYALKWLAVGAEILDRVNHRPTGGNQEPHGYSVFARGGPTPAISAFARVDVWEPDHRLANRVDQQLWIAGLDWQPIKDAHFMPNVESMQYVAKGTGVVPPHHDLQARITFYYKFSRPQTP
jgi:hypothetical protein